MSQEGRPSIERGQTLRTKSTEQDAHTAAPLCQGSVLVTSDTGVDRAPAFETLTVDHEADSSGAPEMATRGGPGSKGNTSSAWEKLSGTDVTSSGKERQDFAKGRLFQAKAASRAKAWGVKKTNLSQKPRRWPRRRNMAERTEGGSRHWSFKGQLSFLIQFKIFPECPRA